MWNSRTGHEKSWRESPSTHVVSSVCFYLWSHVFVPILCACVYGHEQNCLLNNILFPLFIHTNDTCMKKKCVKFQSHHTEIQHETKVASTESSLKKLLYCPLAAHMVFFIGYYDIVTALVLQYTIWLFYVVFCGINQCSPIFSQYFIRNKISITNHCKYKKDIAITFY